jgi:hypothetical protein
MWRDKSLQAMPSVGELLIDSLTNAGGEYLGAASDCVAQKGPIYPSLGSKSLVAKLVSLASAQRTGGSAETNLGDCMRHSLTSLG